MLTRRQIKALRALSLCKGNWNKASLMLEMSEGGLMNLVSRARGEQYELFRGLQQIRSLRVDPFIREVLGPLPPKKR